MPANSMKYAKHPMSKMAYRAHILGMYVRVMRSFLFNLVVFFAGVSIGMGFTVMKMQKMWQENDDAKAFMSLSKTLKNHNMHSKIVDAYLAEIKRCIMEDRNER